MFSPSKSANQIAPANENDILVENAPLLSASSSSVSSQQPHHHPRQPLSLARQQPRSVNDAHVMSASLIADICKKKGGYRTPELNEHLYLHFRGFSVIRGLEDYVNCRVLWLENNNLESLEGLETLTVLHSLYLQHNCFSSLRNTPLYPSIRSLNLSHNKLNSLEGIEALPNLEKLLASHNDIEDCVQVSSLPHLQVLDLSHNKIKDAVLTREVVSKCKALASLMLHGNPELSTVKHYRKTLIVENKQLRYLDEYPVFDDERRKATAFMAGGWEQERDEKCKIDAEEVARQMAQRAFFQKVLEDARTKAAAAVGGEVEAEAVVEPTATHKPSTAPSSGTSPNRTSTAPPLSNKKRNTAYFEQQMDEMEREARTMMRNEDAAVQGPNPPPLPPPRQVLSRTNEKRFTVLPTHFSDDDDDDDAIYIPPPAPANPSSVGKQITTNEHATTTQQVQDAEEKVEAEEEELEENRSSSAAARRREVVNTQPIPTAASTNPTTALKPKHFDCMALDEGTTALQQQSFLPPPPPPPTIDAVDSHDDDDDELEDVLLQQAEMQTRNRAQEEEEEAALSIVENIQIDDSVKETLASYFQQKESQTKCSLD